MEKNNWIKWLQARIPALKDKANEFWLDQALEGYKDDCLASLPCDVTDEEIERMALKAYPDSATDYYGYHIWARIGFAKGFRSCLQPSTWVDVNERLPEDYQYVIALSTDGTIMKLMYCDDVQEVGCWHNASKHFKKHSFKDMGHITHWMPLPRSQERVKKKTYIYTRFKNIYRKT